ncbi:MAG: class I SAM-dependent methyltransferase [Spirulinaceae cyanobacterium RM2_2_10]|nr:class I SAM-dependent methyltransferase [Spirulinaceae cyanobacterium SM2_1_0]NJO21041.1 class I SAM-dependent methyltransferase [Spirulinaceae cyanobacterium RM2_2_10]
MDLLKLDIWEVAEVCNVCSATTYTKLFSVSQKRYVRCKKCQVVRLYDRLQENQLGHLYNDYYSDGNLPEPELNKQLANPTFAFRQQRLERFVPIADRSIFEIGCGDGNFLATLKARGWQVDGLEYHANTVDFVKARHNITVLAGDLLQIPLAPASLQVVGSYHVFEHLYHPTQWLQKVRLLLPPGGILHLQLPNFGGIDARLTQSVWEGLVFPQHVYFYSPKTLEKLLIREGFKPLSTVTYDPWHSPTFTFISYLNLLKSALKRKSHFSLESKICCAPNSAFDHGSAAAIQERTQPMRELAISSAMAFSAWVAKIESWLGFGNVIDVVATAV